MRDSAEARPVWLESWSCRRLFNDQAQRNMEMMKGVEESMKSDSTEPLHADPPLNATLLGG